MANEPVTVQDLPVDQLQPNPWNRKLFDPQQMEELTQAIKADGIQVRLIVRPRQAGGYEIVDGERRWQAAQKAGLKEVPCEVRDFTDEQVAEMDILVNLQREGISPLEMARMVKGYMDQFKATQEMAARKFGKDQSWVSKLTGFLKLPPEVLQNMRALIIGWDQLEALKQSPENIQLQVSNELNLGALKPENIQKRCDQLMKGKGVHRASGHGPEDSEEQADRKEQIQSTLERYSILAKQWAAKGKGYWGASYGTHAVPGQKRSAKKAWQFWVTDEGGPFDQHLAEWSAHLSGLLSDQARQMKKLKEGIMFSDIPSDAMPSSSSPTDGQDEDAKIAAMIARQVAKGRLDR